MDSPPRLQPLIDHLRQHALRIEGPFLLRSGGYSDWYLDARQTTYSGEGSRLVGEAVLGVLDHRTMAVGGMTMGADPIAIATAVLGSLQGRVLRAFSVRKEHKDHGAGGRLVGPVRPGDLVTVVEDTVTTGGALLEAVDVLIEADATPVQSLALVDRSNGLVASRMAERGIPFVALLSPSDLGVD
ncbi:MAG: orotate phosphoribosyltransferase [Acidimicrobiia bacterium]